MAETDIAEAQEQPKSGLKKMLLMGGGAVFLLVLGVVLAPFVTSVTGGDAPAEGEVVEEEADSAASSKAEALYTSLHPPMVVNFQDNGKRHFLQVAIEVMARDESVIDAVKQHNAAIRSNLLLMLGTVDYETVISRDGKLRLQKEALTEVQNVLKEQIGEAGVEAVYFTSLIVQ